MSSRDLGERIQRRARLAGLNAPPDLIAGLERYYTLLAKWNTKVNLTSLPLTVNGDDQAIDRLLLEPLVAAAHLPEQPIQLMDVGSGGGSPAIPLKLAAPGVRLLMVEAKTRKAAFLREAVRELRLETTAVETSRFELLLANPSLHESTDVVSIRAVRIEAAVLNTLQAFLRPGGQIFLFRGPAGADLSDAVAPPLRWAATYPLLSAQRSRLVVLEKVRIR